MSHKENERVPDTREPHQAPDTSSLKNAKVTRFERPPFHYSPKASELRGTKRHEGYWNHNELCLGVEIPSIYDGVLFWDCSDGVLRNRWEKGYWIHDKAEEQMQLWEYRNSLLELEPEPEEEEE